MDGQPEDVVTNEEAAVGWFHVERLTESVGWIIICL